jgi:hypothetical protein
MKSKKIILVIITLLIIIVFSVDTTHANENQHDLKTINEITQVFPSNDFPFFELNGNETLLGTIGPVINLFKIADVKLIDGDPVKIFLIQWILDNNVPFLRSYIFINVSNITFSIKYTINIPKLPLIKRLIYGTFIQDNGNLSAYTEKHTLIVTGFEGQFGFSRIKPIFLFPAYFVFLGTFDNVIVLK